jgi:hypothetical protein
LSERCTICEGEFNPSTEGGRSGYIGILPVNFCPTCTAGILDFAEQNIEHTSTVVIEAGIEAAQLVKDRWEKGDLAEAVRQLEDWAVQAGDYGADGSS